MYESLFWVAQGQIFIALLPAFLLKSVQGSLHIVRVNRTGPPILAGSSPLVISDSRRYCSFSLLVPFQYAQRYFRSRWSRCKFLRSSTYVYILSLQETAPLKYSLAMKTFLLINRWTLSMSSPSLFLSSFHCFWYRHGAKFAVFTFLWCCYLFITTRKTSNIGFIHVYFWGVDKYHCYYQLLQLSGIDVLEHWPAALNHCRHYLTVWTWIPFRDHVEREYMFILCRYLYENITLNWSV